MTTINATGERRREALIDAAIRVIAEHGVDGASLSRIAAEADMSKPAVLYYLENRDALIDLAVDRVFERFTELIGPHDTGENARTTLFCYVERVLRVSWENPVLLRAGYAIRYTHPQLHAQHRVADLQRLFEAGKAEGSLDVLDVHRTALAFDGGLDAVLLAGLSERADLDGLVLGTLHTLERIITPR